MIPELWKTPGFPRDTASSVVDAGDGMTGLCLRRRWRGGGPRSRDPLQAHPLRGWQRHRPATQGGLDDIAGAESVVFARGNAQPAVPGTRRTRLTAGDGRQPGASSGCAERRTIRSFSARPRALSCSAFATRSDSS